MKRLRLDEKDSDRMEGAVEGWIAVRVFILANVDERRR